MAPSPQSSSSVRERKKRQEKEKWVFSGSMSIPDEIPIVLKVRFGKKSKFGLLKKDYNRLIYQYQYQRRIFL